MTTVFEQPKHLCALSYRRVVRSLAPGIVIYASLLSALVLLALWNQAAHGEHISTLHFVLGATTGLWVAILVWFRLRFERTRRRYFELRLDGLFIPGRGFIG